MRSQGNTGLWSRQVAGPDYWSLIGPPLIAGRRLAAGPAPNCPPWGQQLRAEGTQQPQKVDNGKWKMETKTIVIQTRDARSSSVQSPLSVARVAQLAAQITELRSSQ